MKIKDKTPQQEENKAPETPDAELKDGAEEAEYEQASAEQDQAREATIEEWQAALEKAVEQRDGYLDSLRRTQADFQNFKRRNATARSDGYDEGIRETLTAMLPVIDNLERAIEAAEKQEGGEALVEGVKMTLKTMFESMQRFGFEEVPALGEEFDPEKHNAVMREVGEEPGKILEVFQKGYRVKDKIIRYAMVKVAVEE